MSQAPAWWEEVEHLREAAERRIAERECAQREGREPIALTPLRPLSDAERGTAAPEHPAGAPTPLAAAPKVREGRFRRATAALGAQGPRPAAHHVATASRSAPTAGALALPRPTADPRPPAPRPPRLRLRRPPRADGGPMDGARARRAAAAPRARA